MGIANFADDNTPHATAVDTVSLLNIIEKNVEILRNWLENNFFKLNADKCNLLISNHDDDVKFKERVTSLCKKVSRKLHALARIANYTNKDESRLILKAVIESQFQYCPLVWMFHSRTLNNRINRLHERALRLAYTEAHLSFEELLRKDKSFTIHHRNLQKLAIEMHKFRRNLSPDIIIHII